MDGQLRSGLPAVMRAARLATPGGPENIAIEQVPLPELSEGDVLVEVAAAAITPSELGWVPTWTHPDGTSRTPVIPSHELAGTIVGIARGVAGVELGTPVFGLTDFYRDGAAAEYVAVAADALAERPSNLDASRAAALPISAVTAWQALFDVAHLLSGERVMIHGAAGGVGSFAVQLAHIQGASVIAVCSTSDFDYVRALGANELVDRHAADLGIANESVDVVFDTVGQEAIQRSWPVLKSRGRLVSVAPSSRDIATVDVRGHFFIVAPDRGVLDELARLVLAHELVVNVEREFPLADARAAYEFGQQQHPRGKVVLRVRD